jgi:hypothetical protein
MTVIPSNRPFIMRFATPIGHGGQQTIRYDVHRQLSQVLVGGAWLDAAKVRGPTGIDSRFTRVAQETTDDE